MNCSELGDERDELGRVKVMVGELGLIGSVILKAFRMGLRMSSSGLISWESAMMAMTLGAGLGPEKTF